MLDLVCNLGSERKLRGSATRADLTLQTAIRRQGRLIVRAPPSPREASIAPPRRPTWYLVEGTLGPGGSSRHGQGGRNPTLCQRGPPEMERRLG